MMKTPIRDALSRFCGLDYSRFFMPGHKGTLDPLDLTETPLTGDLYEESGFFADSMRQAADCFGVPALRYCAGGSTLCIQAMAAAFLPMGGRVAVRRTVHRSVLNAFALLDITPVFVPEPADAAAIISALDGCRGAFITDPDYYGNTIDIAAIAAACRQKGIPLLVDGAHRAHFPALGLPCAVNLGASAECVSLHKTLPALTGAAAVLLADPADGDKIRRAMQTFGSSSPSYIISLSAEHAAASLQTDAEKWQLTAERCGRLCGSFSAATVGFDPTRLRIDMSGCADPSALLEKYRIAPEFIDPLGVAVLLTSPCNTDEDFARLERLCAALPPPVKTAQKPPDEPLRRLSPRQAMSLPSRRVSIEQAVGMTAAEPLCPCPPCYAAADRGEVITARAAEFCGGYGISCAIVL